MAINVNMTYLFTEDEVMDGMSVAFADFLKQTGLIKVDPEQAALLTMLQGTLAVNAIKFMKEKKDESTNQIFQQSARKKSSESSKRKTNSK